MATPVCTVPIPKTLPELEQAIRYYKTHELDEQELYCRWEAIRHAAIELSQPEPKSIEVEGEDSY